MPRKGKVYPLEEMPIPLIVAALYSAPMEMTVGELRKILDKMAAERATPAFKKGIWYPIETAPEKPSGDYWAKDCLGFEHKTSHPRATLMHAGWAVSWSPIEDWSMPDERKRIFREDVTEIIAMHAREFKRLLKGHGRADEVIEGVTLAK